MFWKDTSAGQGKIFSSQWSRGGGLGGRQGRKVSRVVKSLDAWVLPTCPWPPQPATTMRLRERRERTGSDHTFVGRLWVGRKWDVIQLSQAEPFSIHRHSEFAKVDGLHGSLCDLVSGGGWHIGRRRQSRHDDSAGTPTHTHKHTHLTKRNKTASPTTPKSKALEQSTWKKGLGG